MTAAAVMFTLNLSGDEVQRLSTMSEKCVYSVCTLDQNDISGCFELGQLIAENTSMNNKAAVKRKLKESPSKMGIQVSRFEVLIYLMPWTIRLADLFLR